MVLKITDVSKNLFSELDDKQSMVVSGGGTDGFLNNLSGLTFADLLALASQGKQINTVNSLDADQQ